METFSTLLTICAGNSPVPPHYKGRWRGALMFSLICVWINVFSKQWWGWWFETLSRPLWLHRNAGDTLCASKLLTEERYSEFFSRSRPPPWVIITQLRWLLMTGWLRVRTLPRIPHHLMALIIWSCHSNWSRWFFSFCSSFLINCCHFNTHVFKYTVANIEADLKWTPICRRHFQYHYLV